MSATLQAELTQHEPIICLINLLFVTGANGVNYCLLLNGITSCAVVNPLGSLRGFGSKTTGLLFIALCALLRSARPCSCGWAMDARSCGVC